jgi:hypothetical protein
VIVIGLCGHAGPLQNASNDLGFILLPQDLDRTVWHIDDALGQIIGNLEQVVHTVHSFITV